MPIRLWIALPGPAVWTPDRSPNRAPAGTSSNPADVLLFIVLMACALLIWLAVAGRSSTRPPSRWRSGRTRG